MAKVFPLYPYIATCFLRQPRSMSDRRWPTDRVAVMMIEVRQERGVAECVCERIRQFIKRRNKRLRDVSAPEWTKPTARIGRSAV